MAKKKNEFKTDFGRWKVPESWDEVTLEQLCAINRKNRANGQEPQQSFNIYDNLEILTGKKRKDVEELPYEFIESIMLRMTFLLTPLPEYEPQPYITLDGQKYIANLQEKMTVGEYAAIDSIIRNDEDDLPSVLAVLFRLEGEKYNEDYELNKFDQRKEMFAKAPVTAVMPGVSFFLQLFGIQKIISQLCSQAKGQINDIASSLKTSNGNSDSHITFWKKRHILKTLKKLSKQI